MSEEIKTGAEDNNSATGNEEVKTYTQEEVDKLLQSEADRRVTEALKKQERKNQEKLKESEKLARMNADEKYAYELEQREKAIEAKEKALALAENKNEASKILAEKGLSLQLVDFVVADDADVMDANIKALDKAFKASVKAEVEKRLGSESPKKNLPLDQEMTKDAFRKLSIMEQQKIARTNPELYSQMTQ